MRVICKKISRTMGILSNNQYNKVNIISVIISDLKFAQLSPKYLHTVVSSFESESKQFHTCFIGLLHQFSILILGAAGFRISVQKKANLAKSSGSLRPLKCVGWKGCRQMALGAWVYWIAIMLICSLCCFHYGSTHSSSPSLLSSLPSSLSFQYNQHTLTHV